MEIKIREAAPHDFDRLEQILIQNDMLNFPEIDGKEAMQRIYNRMPRYFLVAESDSNVIGMIRGCYDGSRALIHQMAVDKKYQRKGAGKYLICAIASNFKQDGAKSVSVTATEQTKSYYGHLGFSDIPITLVVAFDINNVLEKTKPSS